MKTYNILYTINGIECQISVNATSEQSAIETVEFIVPNASKIVLIP